MTGVRPRRASDKQLDLLAALQEVESDATGTRTYERYNWQAKQAVLQWIMAATDPNLIAVVCERVDDLVTVRRDNVTFRQLKTRDRGSWTAKLVCSEGYGIDSLSLSFLSAQRSPLEEYARYELMLEGAPGQGKDTIEFFADPSSANSDLKSRIRSNGLTSAQCSRFLSRLSIRPYQPTRRDIDSRAIRVMMSIWPQLTGPECETLYEALLTSASNAQSSRMSPWAVRSKLSDLMLDSTQDVGDDPFEFQVLSAEKLFRIVPPTAGEPLGDWMSRGRAISDMSNLELKLRWARADSETILRAATLRARADVQLKELLASQRDAVAQLETLAGSLLGVAHAASREIGRRAGTDPGAYSRVGSVVMDHLLSRPSDMNALDRDGLFADVESIVGFLCILSDECRFAWRAS